MMPDHDLLRRYCFEGEETAFEEVVRRYVNLVYHSALRRLNGNEQNAKDVAQAVFSDLARNAGSISADVPLGAYLHRATFFACTKFIRTELRRCHREAEALATQEIMSSESKIDWEHIAPFLDGALNRLSQADRSAILMRYFEQRSLADVGTALGLTEDSARKRITRALDKLRLHLSKRGVTTTATALSTAFASHAAQAAPAGLAATIASASISSAPAGAGGGFGVLKLFTLTKAKLALLVGLVSIGVSVPVIINRGPRLFDLIRTSQTTLGGLQPAKNDPAAIALLKAADAAMRTASWRIEAKDNIRLSTAVYLQHCQPDGTLRRAPK